MRKKAQMEIIGLVVIVILIALGMLFMAQFALKSDSSKKIFVRKGLAYSTMGALMKTEAECEDYSLYGLEKTNFLAIESKLLDDCAEHYQEYVAGDRSDYNCNNKHSCEFTKNLIEDRLEETLGKWNKHYEFRSILLLGENPPTLIEIKNPEGIGCPKERDSSGMFPLSTQNGLLVETVLYVCD
ncbi:MAG: hypothetical protein ACFFDN_37555 [Candidatus Hodarchaeota archaeon]